jgi:tRNA A37 threonylcarbamoyltransferase TsaD
VIAGGVAANRRIHDAFSELIDKEFSDVVLLFPDKGLTGDNSLMIGIAGYLRAKNLLSQNLPFPDRETIKAEGNLSLSLYCLLPIKLTIQL